MMAAISLSHVSWLGAIRRTNIPIYIAGTLCLWIAVFASNNSGLAAGRTADPIVTLLSPTAVMKHAAVPDGVVVVKMPGPWRIHSII